MSVQDAAHQHHARHLRADTPSSSNAMPSITSVAPNTAVPVVLVNSVDTSPPPAVGDAVLPASNSITTTHYGSGQDAIVCNLVTTSGPGSNTTTHSQCVMTLHAGDVSASGQLCMQHAHIALQALPCFEAGATPISPCPPALQAQV